MNIRKSADIWIVIGIVCFLIWLQAVYTDKEHTRDKSVIQDTAYIEDEQVTYETETVEYVQMDYTSENYNKDLVALTRALFHESRANVSKKQQKHLYEPIFASIMNRVKSDRFPNSIYRVINQEYQYSYTLLNSKVLRSRELNESDKFREARTIAHQMLSNKYYNNDCRCLFYITRDMAMTNPPSWFSWDNVTTVNTQHVFTDIDVKKHQIKG